MDLQPVKKVGEGYLITSDHFDHLTKLTALGEIACGVAHDLNNFLTSALGTLQLLSQDIQDPKIKKEFAVIELAILDGAETLRRLHRFYKKKVHETFVGVDLKEILEDSIAFTKAKWHTEARLKNTHFDLVYDRRRLPPIQGNPTELREVFTNLLLNAIDAMPRGGRIVIHTKTDRLTVSTAITDTGKGIPQEIQSKIFEPFFTTKGAHGTGLGLSVAYGIISRHQGSIVVDSVEGVGSTFTVTFPAVPRKEAEFKAPPQETAVPQASGARILVIDDDPTIVKVLERILQKAKNDVVTAQSGEEAIRRFVKGKPFDVVFTDIGLPDLSGFEVTKALRERDGQTRIILLTGWGEAIDKAQIEACGADLVVAKPFEVTKILSLVQQAMQVMRS